MSTQSEVRDFLIEEVKRISREKRAALMILVQPVLDRLKQAAFNDPEVLSFQQRIWQYYDLGDKIEELKKQQTELGKEIEREFKTVADAYKVREIDLDHKGHWVPTGGKDRWGGAETKFVEFDSQQAYAHHCLDQLVTAMCLPAALEETGQKEAIDAIEKECHETNRKVFLAMNITALRKIAPELAALGIEVSF